MVSRLVFDRHGQFSSGIIRVFLMEIELINLQLELKFATKKKSTN